MTPRTAPTKVITPQDRDLMKLVEGYLREEGYRFHFMAEDCIEMYLQGKHLTMRMLIYSHNRHLVVRVPGFIRGVEMRRSDLLIELMAMMNEFFDIRFELSPDGHSLSGASNHIVEDSHLTKAQFMQAMMVVAYMVDEHYPRLLKILYGQAAPIEAFSPNRAPTAATGDDSPDEPVTELEDDEESVEEAPLADGPAKPKLN